MANFPSSLPAIASSNPGDTLDVSNHTAKHNQMADEILALATKVGVSSSAVTSTHDYKLSGVGGTDKAASLSGSETLANKIINSSSLNSPTISTPSVSGGSWSSPTITTPGITGGSWSSPTITTPAITNPTISGGGTWSGSPTLATPNIADFTNADHDHTNSANGGLLGTNSVGPLNLAGATLIQGVQDITVSPIASAGPTDVPSSNVTFNCAVPSYMLISWGMACQINSTAFRTVNCALNVDTVNLLSVAAQGNYSSNAVNSYAMSRLLTLTAGSHTIKLQLSTNSANSVAATQIFWYGILFAQ